ncbi:DUF2637 domain-containing protein [Streptomyces sp. NBC_01205]|uniref:DUF2637 domain-containing protein n=1 Tax=Streptomyces sp. NBC_01205 TaxID=2903771 RepID=UPI002E147BBC|nr:DUF2637 domain-containing protein [Streptomyces sp. NBC_01205]
MRSLVISAVACAALIAGIGFTGSYDALQGLAARKGFGSYAYVFPIGIDAGIIAMYALDLILVWRRMAKPMLRVFAHGLTVATVVFNVNAGALPPQEDPLAAAMHGLLPLLFVAVVEAARHMIIKTNRLSLASVSDRVPLHRWLLAPWRTWSLYRRMKLWGITSYPQMVAMEQDRTVYRAWLQHKHGRRWKRKAGAEALLPFKMAAFGLSVDEALALPQEQKDAEVQRATTEREGIAAAAARAEEQELEAEERAAATAVRRLKIAAKVNTAEHRIAAETAAAEAESRAAEAAATAQAKVAEAIAKAEAETAAHSAWLTAEATRRQAERTATTAERTAERAEQAERTAAEVEAEARTAAAHRSAAEDRKLAATAMAEVAASERSAAQDRRNAAVADGEAAEHLAKLRQAEEQTAEAERRAAEHRAATAQAEAAALEAEDLARLTARERAERKSARMILAAHAALPAGQRPERPDMYAVSLEEVGEALRVSRTVASERRQAGAELIANGYTG